MVETESRFDHDEFQKRLIEAETRKVSHARLIRDLVTEVYGEVLSVSGYSNSTRVTEGTINIGGHNTSRGTGYTSRLEFTMQPDESFQSIMKLTFYGNSPIMPGNFVRAGIFVGVRQDLHAHVDDERVYTDEGRGFERSRHFVYVPRDLEKEEEAIYLRIIRDADKGVRTDFCVDYNFRTFPALV